MAKKSRNPNARPGPPPPICAVIKSRMNMVCLSPRVVTGSSKHYPQVPMVDRRKDRGVVVASLDLVKAVVATDHREATVVSGPATVVATTAVLAMAVSGQVMVAITVSRVTVASGQAMAAVTTDFRAMA